MNIGEEIVSAYLQHIKNCEFIQKNLYTPDVQGEIDVVGIDLRKEELYICEVAIHLKTGLQYVKNGQPNNVSKLVDKFSKDIEYSMRHFKRYKKKHFMFWSPIVKNQRQGAKHNQREDVRQVQTNLKRKYGIDVELVINEKFHSCLMELREYASKQSKALKSPILRLMQIEEYLRKNAARLKRE